MNPGLASTALGFATTVAVVLAATLEAGGLDDAYITYVFARRLADGERFTWLPGGPRVYGTSTLPYALLLAATRVLGAEIPPASMVIGAVAWGVADALLFLLVRRCTGTAAGLLAAGLSRTRGSGGARPVLTPPQRPASLTGRIAVPAGVPRARCSP